MTTDLDAALVKIAELEGALREALEEIKRYRTAVASFIAADLEAHPPPDEEEVEALVAEIAKPEPLDRIIEVLERYGFHDEEECDTTDDLVAEVEAICSTLKEAQQEALRKFREALQAHPEWLPDEAGAES